MANSRPDTPVPCLLGMLDNCATPERRRCLLRLHRLTYGLPPADVEHAFHLYGFVVPAAPAAPASPSPPPPSPTPWATPPPALPRLSFLPKAQHGEPSDPHSDAEDNLESVTWSDGTPSPANKANGTHRRAETSRFPRSATLSSTTGDKSPSPKSEAPPSPKLQVPPKVAAKASLKPTPSRKRPHTSAHQESPRRSWTRKRVARPQAYKSITEMHSDDDYTE